MSDPRAIDRVKVRLSTQIWRLEAENAQLLAALKEAHAYLENAVPVTLVEKMKAAIDRVTVHQEQPQEPT